MERKLVVLLSIILFFVYFCIAYYMIGLNLISALVISVLLCIIIMNILYPIQNVSYESPDSFLIIYIMINITGILICILYIIYKTLYDSRLK